jgi:tRNA wybutosine-synthesizing protein 3
MHVHGNVNSGDEAAWTTHVTTSIRALGAAQGKRWRVVCTHLERVKSYAPRVWHMVADVRCTVDDANE